jgi:hypothetical protein
LGRNALRELIAEDDESDAQQQQQQQPSHYLSSALHPSVRHPEVDTFGSSTLLMKKNEPRLPIRDHGPSDLRSGKRKKNKNKKKNQHGSGKSSSNTTITNTNNTNTNTNNNNNNNNNNNHNNNNNNHNNKSDHSTAALTSYDRTLPIGVGMPTELEKNMGLRQVLTILVVGQLNDVEILLQIVADNGLRVLAHSRTDGEQLILGSINNKHTMNVSRKLPKTPPYAAKLLRSFSQVASSFALIFHRPDPSSTQVLGAGKLGDGQASAEPSSSSNRGGKSRMRRAHRAAEAVTKLTQWLGVGSSRGELLRGVCEWLGGQAAMAHHHWQRAIEMAVADGGELAYDAAVAKFLLGKHRLASATLYQWTELVKADAHFAKLGEGARRELEGVRAELAMRRGVRPKNALPGKDVVGVPPAFPYTREFDAPTMVRVVVMIVHVFFSSSSTCFSSLSFL